MKLDLEDGQVITETEKLPCRVESKPRSTTEAAAMTAQTGN